jgi:hypothetical protein
VHFNTPEHEHEEGMAKEDLGPLCHAPKILLDSCDLAGPGMMCEGSGECATDDGLDNCGTKDVYWKQAIPPAASWRLGSRIEPESCTTLCERQGLRCVAEENQRKIMHDLDTAHKMKLAMHSVGVPECGDYIASNIGEIAESPFIEWNGMLCFHQAGSDSEFYDHSVEEEDMSLKFSCDALPKDGGSRLCWCSIQPTCFKSHTKGWAGIVWDIGYPISVGEVGFHAITNDGAACY